MGPHSQSVWLLIEYRQSTKHGNAEQMRWFGNHLTQIQPLTKKEGGEDMDSIFTIKTISRQIRPTEARVVAKQSAKDPVVSAVIRYCKEGWPNNNNQRDSKGSSMSSFKQLKDSLSCESGCLFYGSRLVILRWSFSHQSCRSYIKVTLECRGWSSYPAQQFIGLDSTPKSWTCAVHVTRAWNIRTILRKLPSIHGWCQKSVGVECTLITKCTSWDTHGWCWLTLTRSIQ